MSQILENWTMKKVSQGGAAPSRKIFHLRGHPGYHRPTVHTLSEWEGRACLICVKVTMVGRPGNFSFLAPKSTFLAPGKYNNHATRWATAGPKWHFWWRWWGILWFPLFFQIFFWNDFFRFFQIFQHFFFFFFFFFLAVGQTVAAS